jgi:hypothetical protein
MAYAKPADQIGYAALHSRLTRWRGQASQHQCVRCPAPARDWAQVHTEDGTDVWTDYVPMCRRCHMAYDRESHVLIFARTAEIEARRLAGIRASWTPERIAREATRHDPFTGRFAPADPRE